MCIWQSETFNHEWIEVCIDRSKPKRRKKTFIQRKKLQLWLLFLRHSFVKLNSTFLTTFFIFWKRKKESIMTNKGGPNTILAKIFLPILWVSEFRKKKSVISNLTYQIRWKYDRIMIVWFLDVMSPGHIC